MMMTSMGHFALYLAFSIGLVPWKPVPVCGSQVWYTTRVAQSLLVVSNQPAASSGYSGVSKELLRGLFDQSRASGLTDGPSLSLCLPTDDVIM